MRLYCVTYTQRDDEVGEHDTVEYFRTKQDALAAIRGLSAIVEHHRPGRESVFLDR